MIPIEEEFDWIGTTVRSSAERTRETREDEVKYRAFLFARLGFPKKRAQQRLEANLAWECEQLGKPKLVKKLSGLIAAEYKRAGVKHKKR